MHSHFWDVMHPDTDDDKELSAENLQEQVPTAKDRSDFSPSLAGLLTL